MKTESIFTPAGTVIRGTNGRTYQAYNQSLSHCRGCWWFATKCRLPAEYKCYQPETGESVIYWPVNKQGDKKCSVYLPTSKTIS